MRDARNADSFFEVPTVRQPTSAGDVDLPIRYRDASAITLFHRVPEANARPALEARGLVPFADGKGRAGVAITWFEYRGTSVGQYNELSVAVLAKHPRAGGRASLRDLVSPHGLAGACVLHLPVTTEVANAAGREIWGYPKIVADMPIELRSDHMRASLGHEGRTVLTTEVPLRRGLPLPMPDFSTWTVLDGRLIRTTIRTRGRVTATRGRGARTTVEAPDHPIGQTLGQLGVHGAPDAIVWTHRFQSLLPFGIPVADVPPRSLEGRP